MHLIIYISDLEPSFTSRIDDVLTDITQVAKEENLKRQITGVLFFKDNKFLQVIEGSRADLEYLMYKIEHDDRHMNIEYLVNCPVEERGFADWNMDVFHIGAGKHFNHQTLRNLTASFEKELLKRSDQLVNFYKALLQEEKRSA